MSNKSITLTARNITLTQAESLRWEDGGPDGEQFRQGLRRMVASMPAEVRHVEIYSHDGIVLDAIERKA